MSNLVNNFYPRKQSEETLRRKLMRKAYLEGDSPKKIAGNFGVSITTVYLNLNVRALKVKKAEQKFHSQGKIN